MAGKTVASRGPVHHLIKKVDPEAMIEVAVKRATCQPGVVKQEGMTESADKFLADRTGMLQEEFFTRVGERLEGIIDMILGDFEEKHHLIPPQNLPYAFGVLMDKASVIAGRPQALTAQLNVGLGRDGMSREEVVAMLTAHEGKKGEKDLKEK